MSIDSLAFLLQISFVHFSVSCLFIDLLRLFIFCIKSINLRLHKLKIFSISLPPLFTFLLIGIFNYTEDFTLLIIKFVVFLFLASEYRVLLRRGEPFIVYKALSFLFSHTGLGHMGSVKYI